jgi:hypothetical protein
MYKRVVFFSFLILASFGKKNHIETKNYVKVSPLSTLTSVDNESVAVLELYQSIHSNGFSLPNYDCFEKAIDGFSKLQKIGIVKKTVLTIIDFDLPSTEKRLWVIDMTTSSILFHTYVAHGKNSGELYANQFSNESESFKSSLGFYSTGEVYNGKHGKSLKLDGLEKGINDNARNRGIVIHAADYVSDFFIKAHNRLGRSQGCPALPIEFTEKIINKIKGKSCLYIYYPNSNS